MKKLWFVRKSYGWGWTPASWEGWSVLAVFIALTVWNFFRIDAHQHSASDTLLNWAPQTLLTIVVLVMACFLTGEPPKWQWGEHKKK